MGYNSLVDKYGTPRSQRAALMEQMINEAFEFLAQQNRDNREAALFERKIEHDRRSNQISALTQQWGSHLNIPPEAYTDDNVLSGVLAEAAQLSSLKESALGTVKQTGGSLSDFAEDALSFGGVEITAIDGSTQNLDLDLSPLAIDANDVEITEQWLIGNMGLDGVLNRDAITNEEIAEMERLGLVDFGVVTEENWDAGVHGEMIRNNWKHYKSFLRENKDYYESNEYTKLVTDSITQHNTELAQMYAMPDYKGSAERLKDFENQRATLLIDKESGNYVVHGKEFSSWDELNRTYPVLAKVMLMKSDALVARWGDLSQDLATEAKTSGYGGSYHDFFNGMVNDFMIKERIESEYDFNPMHAKRQATVAQGVMDAMHDFQLDIDPLILSLQQRVLSGDIQTEAELGSLFKKELTPSLARSQRKHGQDPKYGPQSSQVFTEEFYESVMNSYYDQLLNNVGWQ